MKKIFVLLTFFASSFLLSGQNYRPDWKSLDSRPVAPWFEDAKFGIFIHWGVYSVPAWSPRGTYSEWYQYWLQEKKVFGNGKYSGTEVYDYHVKNFGEDVTYYDLAKYFKADLYDPEAWTRLFERAGAKYIVVTSKHHDGYTMWPNVQANDRGFPWNSVDVGPHRDLLGELEQAIRKTDIKFGIYYSLYEWYHPLWRMDREKFVTEHFIPQFKDLINNYKPDIIWPDGEWEMTSEAWHTPELLAWLFNESPVAQTIVINDRWGKGCRKKHGGYYTTEYEAGADFDKPWEECRGMGFSFGYNRAEDMEDYNSAKALVLLLVDVVSRGGNLLLDIGPTAHGKIPVIMQERLVQMGNWLKVNGEAIYGTRKWEKAVQWSEGDRNFKPAQHYLGGDYILKQTVDPEPGYAVKELFFTRKNSDLFAISPRWPGKELVVKGVRGRAGMQVTLLGYDGTLSWENRGEELVVKMPAYDPGLSGGDRGLAYAFKFTGLAK
jgi:alpha-L-fucosidase